VVTFLQEDRPIATSTVLLHVPDPDVIRHASPMKPVGRPGSHGTRTSDRGLYEVGIIEASELDGPDDVGSPDLPMWVRFNGGRSDEATNQALLAFVTNFHLIGVAMRPHAGLSVEQSHLRVTTGVLSHTVAFHEPFDAHQWLLLDQEVPYAGRGRSYGRGSVFTEDGVLVASFAQDGLIRAMAEARSPDAVTSRL
jgi:acyl-CoA thioesterase